MNRREFLTAGLAAAYELAEAGHDVTVLEAQMHSGGSTSNPIDLDSIGVR
jgi:uncharacterized protein with NAD-binding domain and iron-sulfur cluster